MNICMVAYSFYDSDNRVRRYAEALVKKGNSVDVLAIGHKGQKTSEKINGVRVYRVQKRVRNERNKWSYLVRLGYFLLKTFFVISWFQIIRRYRLIHVHSVPDFEIFAALVPKLLGARLILDVHDIVPEFYMSKFGGGKDSLGFRLLVLVEKLSCMFADHVVISNHLWEKAITGRSVPVEKCTTILNYPDTSVFKRPEHVLQRGGLVLLYPGTLSRHQGLHLAIQAFAEISPLYSDAEFHIYGEGPDKEMLIKQAAESGSGDRIKFFSQLSLEEVSVRMAGSDIGIVPKLGEGFGGNAFSTKILEFMVMGVPVICSRTMVDPYYFNEKVVSFFSPGEAADLARAMKEMMSDTVMRKTQAENALEFVKDYTWQGNQKLYFDVLKKIGVR